MLLNKQLAALVIREAVDAETPHQPNYGARPASFKLWAGAHDPASVIGTLAAEGLFLGLIGSRRCMDPGFVP